MALVSVKNLSKFYREHHAIKNISFEFSSGKCVALIGPNGAGKTTTLRMLAGLLNPTEGSIRFAQMNANDDIRSLIGYLPQYPSFYTWMTGKEFLVYSGELTHLSRSEASKRAEDLLI